ncbi:hypothetical protein Tco_0926609 [Tanacetum coccineum]|uniref:Uncharacterized protein n=1 Tax=Tanacetum coccineum TaxID=301880 RepID=A0ABQ5DBC4_9ASTR
MFCLASTSGGINDFFLKVIEESRVVFTFAADPDSMTKCIADIIFRVETITESAASPPRNRRKHLGVRSDDCLWDKPVEDFFSSESESDDTWYFRLNPDVNIGLHQSYECLASAPVAALHDKWISSSPWLTPRRFWLTIATALRASPTGVRHMVKTLQIRYELPGIRLTILLTLKYEEWLVMSQNAIQILLTPIDLLFCDAAFYGFLLLVLSLPEIFISADGIKSFLLIMFLLVMFSFLLTEIESADLDL